MHDRLVIFDYLHELNDRTMLSSQLTCVLYAHMVFTLVVCYRSANRFGLQERFNLAHISDAPKDKPDPQVVVDRERQKALKKRCRKLRQRMAHR